MRHAAKVIRVTKVNREQKEKVENEGRKGEFRKEGKGEKVSELRIEEKVGNELRKVN
jgi:hypothetical protein